MTHWMSFQMLAYNKWPISMLFERRFGWCFRYWFANKQTRLMVHILSVQKSVKAA